MELPLELVVGVYGGGMNGRLHVDLARINSEVLPKIVPKPVDFAFPIDEDDNDVTQ